MKNTIKVVISLIAVLALVLTIATGVFLVLENVGEFINTNYQEYRKSNELEAEKNRLEIEVLKKDLKDGEL